MHFDPPDGVGPSTGTKKAGGSASDPRWEGSGGDGVTGRTDGQGPPSAMCTSLIKNTKTGGVRGPHPNPSSAAPICTHLGPCLGWPTLGGDVGCFKVTEPTKAPPPGPPILAPSYLALSCPLPAEEALGHHPSRAPRARPHPPTALPGTLVSTKLPKTSPAFEASNPHHLSVCPQGPSSRGTIGTPRRPLFRWGSDQWVDLASPL